MIGRVKPLHVDNGRWAPQIRRHQDLIDFMKQQGAVPGQAVLDVGCGKGVLANLLREAGFQEIHGVDWEDEDPAHASVLKTYTKCDLNKEKLENIFSHKFNIIVCSDTLEHLEQPAVVLRSMSQLLAPQGSIYVTLPNAFNVFQRICWLLTGNCSRYRVEKEREFGHISLFPSNVMMSLLNRAGLKCVRRGKGFAAWAGFITKPDIKFGEIWSYANYYELKKEN